MIILGIETSCDETACAVLQKDQNGIHILSNVVASSATLQAKYGGIIPEQAAREQLRSIIPVIQEALTLAFKSNLTSKISNFKFQISNFISKVDAIAVTYGPGLIGSLLVGVETAKTLALVWKKPLIPVNHLIGHFYANWITNQLSVLGGQLSDDSQSVISLSETDKPRAGKLKSENRKQKTENWTVPSFPIIGLLVSGGHTDLVLFKDHGKYDYLGGTRDDAAGECFDKCARLLGLSYPGGPAIAAEAAKFKVQSSKFKVKLPRPMIDSKNFDFSFSGLKTAVAKMVQSSEFGVRSKNTPNTEHITHNLAAAIEQAIVDVLVTKTVLAAQTYHIDQIMISGGVAANQKLISEFKLKIENCKLKINLYVPPPQLCTDNAAMIASAAFFQKPIKNPLDLQANPNLSLS